jgi:Predicted membrane protein
MEFLIFLLVGLIAGVLAKLIMPGAANEPGGWFMTMILGVVGAFLGGFIGRAMGFGGATAAGSFSLAGILWATIGAILVIAIMRLVTGSRRAV